MSRTKKQPTAAQQQAAAERRERFKLLCQRVAAMSEDKRAELAIQCGPRKISGEPFSPHNSCLLLAQHAAPTICGGFHEWRKNGRKIVSGPGSGLAIWVPLGRKKQQADNAAELAADNAADSAKRPGFIMGYVFDISQTAPIGQADNAADSSAE